MRGISPDTLKSGGVDQLAIGPPPFPLARVSKICKRSEFVDVVFTVIAKGVTIFEPINLASCVMICSDFQIPCELTPSGTRQASHAFLVRRHVMHRELLTRSAGGHRDVYERS